MRPSIYFGDAHSMVPFDVMQQTRKATQKCENLNDILRYDQHLKLEKELTCTDPETDRNLRRSKLKDRYTT